MLQLAVFVDTAYTEREAKAWATGPRGFVLPVITTTTTATVVSQAAPPRPVHPPPPPSLSSLPRPQHLKALRRQLTDLDDLHRLLSVIRRVFKFSVTIRPQRP